MLGRWGGEEFIVLLPETSLELAWASAERIRLAVESQLHQLGASTEVPLTISIGISASLGQPGPAGYGGTHGAPGRYRSLSGQETGAQLLKKGTARFPLTGNTRQA